MKICHDMGGCTCPTLTHVLGGWCKFGWSRIPNTHIVSHKNELPSNVIRHPKHKELNIYKVMKLSKHGWPSPLGNEQVRNKILCPLYFAPPCGKHTLSTWFFHHQVPSMHALFSSCLHTNFQSWGMGDSEIFLGLGFGTHQRSCTPWNQLFVAHMTTRSQWG